MLIQRSSTFGWPALRRWSEQFVPRVRIANQGRHARGRSDRPLHPKPNLKEKYDCIIIGAGHNGLVAATYLAQKGKQSVLVLEANATIGGATQSERVFPDYDAQLSRYSYLVSLLPDQIIKDLNLNFQTLSRRVASYTPFTEGQQHAGLHISRVWDDSTASSFQALNGGTADMLAWQTLYGEIESFAERFAPTMLQPLLSRTQLKAAIGMDRVWEYMMERPIGETISANFQNDVVRGVVATDALIGTFVSAYDMQANKCFLYHLIGMGTGEWRVPLGGMGALVRELERAATRAGVTIATHRRVVQVTSDDTEVMVTLEDGSKVATDYLLSNAAPQVLTKLRGQASLSSPSLDGSQVKINMLVKRLPRLKSGADPREAFAGTFHVNQSFSQLETAYQQALAGNLPTPMPLEIYCHTLTDASIISPELQQRGYHTLTLFGLHTPASLFDAHHDAQRERAQQLAMDSLNEMLLDPIESVLAQSTDGALCLETKTPLDLEASLGLPRGNIFHRDLSWPFYETAMDTGPFARWGVETDHPRIFLCGAGAIRGGGVSGIPGHNAAMAVLERTRVKR